MKLAILGDYERADRFSTVSHARYLFFKAVDKVESQVRRDLLEGEPGRLFIQLPAEITIGLTCSKLTQNPSTYPLAHSLLDWAKTWRLEENWCIDQALHLLDLWAWPPPSEEGIELDWSDRVSLTTITTGEERRFTFQHPGGDLAIQTREEIKQAIQKAFKEELDSYLTRLKTLADERKYRPVVKKTNLLHFEMLARYQVQKWNYTKIADRYKYKDKDPRKVAGALPRLAELIGLTLREGRGKRGPDKRKGTRRPRRKSS